MKLKYPNVKSGLDWIYASIIVGIAGNVLSSLLGVFAKMAEVYDFSSLIGIGMGVVTSVLFSYGAYVASKDVKDYAKLFLVSLLLTGTYLVYLVSLFFLTDLLAYVYVILFAVLEFLRLLLVCTVTAKLLRKEEENDISRKSSVIWICYGIYYAYSVLGTLFSGVPGVNEIIAVTVFPCAICVIVGGINYLVFFHQVTKYFEELAIETEEQEVLVEDSVPKKSNKKVWGIFGGYSIGLILVTIGLALLETGFDVTEECVVPLALAMENYEAGEYESALENLELAYRLGLGEEYLSTYYGTKGNVYTATGDYESAITAYQEAILHEPDSVKLYVNLAVAYRRYGDADKALELYEKALEIDPDYPNLNASLGAFYIIQGEPELAIMYYEKALEGEPTMAVAYANGAVAYAMAGNIDKAEDYMKKAEQLGYDQMDLVHEMVDRYR